jgi:hypothetical protein
MLFPPALVLEAVVDQFSPMLELLVAEVLEAAVLQQIMVLLVMEQH